MSEEFNKDIKAFQLEQLNLAEERTYLAIERSQLAYERTFLSWLRTGLGCVGGGIALVRLLAFQSMQHKIAAQMTGSALVLLGIAIFLFSYTDYKKRITQWGVEPERESRVFPATCVISALIAISVLVWLLVLL